MSRSPALLASLFVLPLAFACSKGDDNATFSTAFTGNNPGEGGGMMTESAGTTTANTSGAQGGGPDGNTNPSDGAADGTGDDGNPMCCVPHPQAGCDSGMTESCVCALMPTCCSEVWAAECVDHAITCGDPYCTGETAGTDTGGGVELECDPSDWSFSPANPAANVAFMASFTDPIGLTYVGMRAEGPGGSVEGNYNDPVGMYTWPYDFAGLSAGVWTFTFTHRESAGGADLVRGVCQKQFQ